MLMMQMGMFVLVVAKLSLKQTRWNDVLSDVKRQ
jgi:hypothetical protein